MSEKKSVTFLGRVEDQGVLLHNGLHSFNIIKALNPTPSKRPDGWNNLCDGGVNADNKGWVRTHRKT